MAKVKAVDRKIKELLLVRFIYDSTPEKSKHKLATGNKHIKYIHVVRKQRTTYTRAQLTDAKGQGEAGTQGTGPSETKAGWMGLGSRDMKLSPETKYILWVFLCVSSLHTRTLSSQDSETLGTLPISVAPVTSRPLTAALPRVLSCRCNRAFLCNQAALEPAQ